MSSRRRRISNDLMVSSAVLVCSALRNLSSSDNVLLDTRIEVTAVVMIFACGMQYMKYFVRTEDSPASYATRCYLGVLVLTLTG